MVQVSRKSRRWIELWIDELIGLVEMINRFPAQQKEQKNNRILGGMKMIKKLIALEFTASVLNPQEIRMIFCSILLFSSFSIQLYASIERDNCVTLLDFDVSFCVLLTFSIQMKFSRLPKRRIVKVSETMKIFQQTIPFETVHK